MALLGIVAGSFLYAGVRERFTPGPYFLGVACAIETFFLAVPYGLGDRLAVLAATLRSLVVMAFPALSAAGW